MNHCVKIVFVLCACIALTSAQFGHFGVHFSDFGSSFGAPSYSGYSGFSGFSGLSSAGGRDPRGDRGPVLFPPSPSGGVEQSSGVVVGASGYGFVPPSSQDPRHRSRPRSEIATPSHSHNCTSSFYRPRTEPSTRTVNHGKLRKSPDTTDARSFKSYSKRLPSGSTITIPQFYYKRRLYLRR